MEWVTTSTLLERLHGSSEGAAWSHLVEHFRAPIRRLAMSLELDDTDAQDVVQETLMAFLKAYRTGKFDRNRGRLSSWLFGIALRQAKHLRTQRSKQRRGQDDTARVDELPDRRELQRIWDEQWRWDLYKRALRQVEAEVTYETFRIFELLVTRRLKVEEVCREMGVSRTTVYNAKHRVARRLSELVASYGNL